MASTSLSFNPLTMDNLNLHRNSVEVCDGSSAKDDLLPF
jgi:hypothetical protein